MVTVNLEEEEIFDAVDHLSAVFGEPDTYLIHRVTFRPDRQRYLGAGFRVLRNGLLAKRLTPGIHLRPDQIPDPIRERLHQ